MFRMYGAGHTKTLKRSAITPVFTDPVTNTLVTISQYVETPCSVESIHCSVHGMKNLKNCYE